ncbi:MULTISPECIES: TIGR02530 family flagellar biosynthesis protein [Geobacter]|uniref:Flagellar protein n=2 Tax=Geobacter TaxID=28231 RepID=A0A0C1U948_9BACT|nr:MULTISPECIES: TIGR02530 family flagellar biosynthesis protein [Geobacter]KIE44085.1 flagellar protein [Geobacter soli]MBE2886451.1 flagellar protein [Geobacter anodireducens]HMN02476.1 TIGR02530 family flagellar biosynthesis protein [Geobacter anodireducens]
MIDSIYFPEPLPINPGRSQSQPQPAQPAGKPGGFARILDGKLPAQEVKFSSHAQQRLQSRGITFSDTDLKRLEGAVESVAQKGGRESLIMLGDAALVVSVRNRTVITAMDRASMQGNVFTNIDSAVII